MSWTVASTLLGGIATLAIFSFLIKENKFYRFFEHLFIGISAGYLPVVTIRNFLWPKILVPLLGYDLHTFPDASQSKPYSYWYLLYIPAMLFGLLYYAVNSRKYGWIAKLVIGFSLGASAALYFKGFFAELLPQLVGSFKPLVVFSQEGEFLKLKSFSNLLFVYTLTAVLVYFFFTFRKGDSRGGKAFALSGRWLMMICFGAFFGSTVMARMALLVDRMQFLLTDCWEALVSLWS